VAQDTLYLRGYIMLEGEEKVRQAREGCLALGTEEAADFMPLLSSASSDALTWAGPMPVNLPATLGACEETICYPRILCWPY